MASIDVLPDTFTGATIADDAVLCTTSRFLFTFAESVTFSLRMFLDLGAVTIPAGTVGRADIAAGFWVQAFDTGAPTDAFASTPSFSWGARAMTRHGTKDQTWPLGSGLIDHAVTLAAGDWEMYVGLYVSNEVDLGTVSVDGYKPSGFIQLGV